MPSRRHHGIGRRGPRRRRPRRQVPGPDRRRLRLERAEGRELGLHLGQTGRVPGHQERVVLVGEVAGVVLTCGVVEGAPQEVTFVGEIPALVTVTTALGDCGRSPTVTAPARAVTVRRLLPVCPHAMRRTARLRRQKTDADAGDHRDARARAG